MWLVPVIQPIVDAGVCQKPWADLAVLGVLSLAVLVGSSGPLASRDYQILGDFHMLCPLWSAVSL